MELKDRKDARASRSWAGLWRERSGATAIEYSLIAALIALAIIIGVGMLGLSVHDMFMMFGTLDVWNTQP
jgi:pilus assembly protein Flp/PilA